MNLNLRVINPETMLPVSAPNQFSSFIWTVRIVEEGEFEFHTLINEELMETFQIGWYLFCDKFYDTETDTAALMVIKSWEISSDSDQGKTFVVRGKDLKDILNRRIVWGRVSFPINTSCKEIITTLLNDNLINPQDWTRTYQDSDTGTITQTVLGADRRIDNFIIIQNEEDFPVTTGEVQYENETLYDVIVGLCNNYKFGFSILYNFGTDKFEFRFLNYKYKTYDQNVNPPVIFAPQYQNLRNSNYIESAEKEKTVGLVTGEGDEYNAMYAVVGSGTGLNRKEVGISGSDVSRTKEDGTEYGNRSYINMLIEKGAQELSKQKYVKTFEGTAEVTRNFNYHEDYDIGDVVEIVNEWGISAGVLISEVVMSMETSGWSIIPTFSNLDDEEDDDI